MSGPIALEIEPTGEATLAPCECCGSSTRRVWGFAHQPDGSTEAAYFVQWVPGAVAHHGAAFDLIIGEWGDAATPDERVAVSLAFRHTSRGPEFMVVDASNRHHAQGGIASQALGRAPVLNSPVAARAFAIVDAIWLQDQRIRELTAVAV